jgi:hypothetical protein
MRYKWANVKNPAWDYPEVYTTMTIHYDQVKVEANRAQGQVRLEVKTLQGEHYESIIKQGVVLREKDMKTGALADLTDHISIYRKDFSSLPDTPLLELIGGNYGILTEFLGTAERIVVKEGSLATRFWKAIKGLPASIRHLFGNLWRNFRYYNASARPADFVDMAVISAATYTAFTYNFDYLSAGFTLCIMAALTGLVDWLIRKREPWLMKIYASVALGSVAVYRGYFFQ